MFKTFFIACVVVAAGLCPAVAMSGGLGTILDRSRFPAELIIIRGDLDRLMTQSLLSRLERQGLQGRIQSALSGLLWLSQEYETLTKHAVDETFISDAQSLWRDRKLDDLRQLVTISADLYALNLEIFKASRASKQDMERVSEIDTTLCQGCHVLSPGSPSTLPAYRLKEFASTMSSHEFLARLLSGIRGSGETTLANPLTLGDVRGFMRLYRSSLE